METLIVVLKLVVAYLIGSLSGSMLLGRWRGIDIRNQGSRSAGGTNALRTQGWAFAAGVVAIDIGKGMLAAALAYLPPSVASWQPLSLALSCGVAAAIGHIWPVYFGFRGGKGAATLVGALLLVAPGVLVLPLLVWAGTLMVSGYVGLATVLAALALPLTVWIMAAPATLGTLFLHLCIMAALIVYTHRENLQRVRAGTEYRFDKARVLGRLMDDKRAP